MPSMNHQQLAALAQTGASLREIVATIGHDLDADERLIVDRARVVARVKRQKDADVRRKSATTRKQDQRKRDRSIPHRQVDDVARRNRLEKNAPDWLMWYMGENTFPYDWSESHREIIHNAENAGITGTGAAVAAPRGEGKTTIMRGMAINLLARRIVRFPVLAGWVKGHADEAFQRWLQMLAESPKFAADYPELTQPFEESTHNLALRNFTWSDSDKPIGAAVRTLHKLIVLPDSLGAIAARSVQSDVKGLNATLPDGTILRPDLLLLDDTQDPAQADNPDAVKKVVDKIENVFFGLAGPQKRLTVFNANTVEAEGDVSCHFLNRKGWASIRISRITSWAGGSKGGKWDIEKDDPIRMLWDEWNRIRLDEGEKKCIKYYLNNYDNMTEGMTVSWEHRFDKERGEPDALYSAMYEYYDKGADVFARAQQNIPLVQNVNIYNLTPALIQSRTSTLIQYEQPEWGRSIVASTDLNPSYAFTTACVTFGEDQSAAVTTYGLYEGLDGHGIVKGDATPRERSQKVYAALIIVGKELAALPDKPDLWMIDAGGTDFKTVLRFCKECMTLCGLKAIGATGRGARNYRPNGRSVFGAPREECHMAIDRKVRPIVKWIAWNADHWKETSQRAWLAPVGSQGSCSLYNGEHQDFTEQICREVLKGKGEVGGQMFWNWHTQPNKHDYCDVMAQAYVGAAWLGIETEGYNPKNKPAAAFFASS